MLIKEYNNQSKTVRAWHGHKIEEKWISVEDGEFLVCAVKIDDFENPSKNFFNFNNPYGACEKCSGHGDFLDLDKDKIIPNKELTFIEAHRKAFKPQAQNLRHVENSNNKEESL